MTIHWYSNHGHLLDTRFPESFSQGLTLGKALTGIIGFAVLEAPKCKMIWFKKGNVQHEPHAD